VPYHPSPLIQATRIFHKPFLTIPMHVIFRGTIVPSSCGSISRSYRFGLSRPRIVLLLKCAEAVTVCSLFTWMSVTLCDTLRLSSALSSLLLSKPAGAYSIDVGSRLCLGNAALDSRFASGRWLIYVANPNCSACVQLATNLRRLKPELLQHSDLHVAIVYIACDGYGAAPHSDARGSDVFVVRSTHDQIIYPAILYEKDGVVQHRFYKHGFLKLARTVWGAS
jgi:hypothetical protein